MAKKAAPAQKPKTDQAALRDMSQGPCRPASRETVRGGVYASIDVPEGVVDVHFINVVVLGDISVRGRGANGNLYKPASVTAYADVSADNSAKVQVIRKPWNELRKIAEN
jgi:hypothetical protein